MSPSLFTYPGTSGATKTLSTKLDTLFVDAMKTIERYEKASDFHNAIWALEELRNKYTHAREILSEKIHILERNTNHPNWKPEYTNLLKELQTVILGLSRKIAEMEKRINKNTKILDTRTKKEHIERVKKEKQEKKEKETTEKNRTPVSIVEVILYGPHAEAPDPTKPKNYEEAIHLIKRLERRGEIPGATAGIHELLLKHEIALTFQDEAIKRLRRFEISSIKIVSDRAKQNIRRVETATKVLHKRIAVIRKLADYYDTKKGEYDTKIADSKVQKALDADIAVIERMVRNRQFQVALGLVKKLIVDFPNNSQAQKVYNSVDKKYRAYIRSQAKNKDKSKQIEDMLKSIEGGIKIEEKMEPLFLERIQERIGLFLSRTFTIRKAFLAQYLDRKRQDALRDLENEIIKQGGISNISDAAHLSSKFNITKEGFLRDLSNFSLSGYNFFGRITSKDQVTGDTFGFKHFEKRDLSVFYLGDATGHGVQASFTISITTKLFFDYTAKYESLQELVTLINNDLKKKIAGKFFMTGIFFEWDIQKKILRFVGGGHDPFYIYRHKTGKLEKVIPGGLAVGVRMIHDPQQLKIREEVMEDGDCMFLYTDGILEARQAETGKLFGYDNLERILRDQSPLHANPKELYNAIMKEVELFRKGNEFDDDVSLHILQRDSRKDIISKKEEVADLIKEMKMEPKTVNIKYGKGKTREEYLREVEDKRHQMELKTRLLKLQQLYELGEFYKLKQETIKYYKEGFADKKMKFYLQKVVDNEADMGFRKQEQKLQNKYQTLMKLYSKGQYDIVIKDCIEIIGKNGKI